MRQGENDMAALLNERSVVGVRPRLGAIVQCTASDLYPSRNASDYCIAVSQQSGVFDAIALAVPDSPESAVFDKLAQEWGVQLIKGPIYNVAERMLKAADQLDVDIIIRLLLRRFYLDVPLVKEMIDQLCEQQADYVRLPRDFNYELGADVFTRKALRSVVESLSGDGIDVAARQFSPWRVMDEDQKHFKTIEHPGSANYSRQRVREIKAKLGQLLDENQVHYGWAFPASSYAYVATYLQDVRSVLDIACGQGEGSRRLKESCQTVVGVDICASYIAGAEQRHGHIQGLRYVCADAESYRSTQPFDAIVSMHTLEHLSQPRAFLASCYENLRDNGTLFIEVPLLLPRPLGEPLYPFHDKEYALAELEELVCTAGFVVTHRVGRDRGVYADISQAREAVQLHCKKGVKTS